MGLTGSLVECSSVLARGSTVRGGWDAGVGPMVGAVVRGTVTRAGVERGTVVRDGAILAASHRMASCTVALAVLVDSMRLLLFMVEQAFTAERSVAAVDFMAAQSMAEAVSMAAAAFMEAADTDKIAQA
jgi:hypothetical protein